MAKDRKRSSSVTIAADVIMDMIGKFRGLYVIYCNSRSSVHFPKTAVGSCESGLEAHT